MTINSVLCVIRLSHAGELHRRLANSNQVIALGVSKGPTICCARRITSREMSISASRVPEKPSNARNVPILHEEVCPPLRICALNALANCLQTGTTSTRTICKSYSKHKLGVPGVSVGLDIVWNAERSF